MQGCAQRWHHSCHRRHLRGEGNTHRCPSMTGSTANGLTTIAYGAWPWPVFSIHAVAVVAPAGPPAPPPKAYTVADQGAQHRREIADDLQLQMQQGLSRPRSRPEWVWIVGPGMFGTIRVVSDDVDPRGTS